MTVAELIEKLERYEPEAAVRFRFDGGYAVSGADNAEFLVLPGVLLIDVDPE